MKYEFEKTIGRQKFRFHGDFDSPAEFFEQVHFFSALPERGPNGSDDVRVHFKTANKHKFYSLMCDEEKMEFKLGIHQEGNGSLFPKQWEPQWNSNGSQELTEVSGGLGDDGSSDSEEEETTSSKKKAESKSSTKSGESKSKAQSILDEFDLGGE